MKRKINRVGQNTLTISIPSGWAKRHNLSPGHEAEVIEEGSVLYISPEPIEIKKGSITLDIPYEKEYMRRILAGPYIKGVEEIRVNFREQAVFNCILEDLKMLLGFEVVSHGADFCVLRNISKGIDTEFETLVNRLFHVARTFATELHNRLVKGKLSDISRLKEYEYTSNRLTIFCKRIINKNLVSHKTMNNTYVYLLISFLERVSDELYAILDFTIENSKKNITLSKSNDILFKYVEESFVVIQNQLINFLKQQHYSNVKDAFLRQKHIRKDIFRNRSKYLNGNIANDVVAHHLLASIEHLQHLSEELV